jgi:hypothetical protein
MPVGIGASLLAIDDVEEFVERYGPSVGRHDRDKNRTKVLQLISKSLK